MCVCVCVCVRARVVGVRACVCVRACVFPYSYVKISPEIRKTFETHSLDQLQVSLPFVLSCSVLHITVAKSEE